MDKFNDELLEEIHKHGINNKAEIEKSDTCGCFFCREMFDPSEIKTWTKDKEETAECPYCKVDSVIGNASGYEISKSLLDAMAKKWFNK